MVKKRIARTPQLLLERSSWFVNMFQALLVTFSLGLAWFLHFDFSLPNRLLLFSIAPVLVLIRFVTIRIFNLHHGWWRYAGVSEALDIAKAVTLGSVGFFLLVHFVFAQPSFPRSIYFIEALLTAALLAGVRLASRALAESARESLAPSRKVIIVGAGFAAEMIIREMKQRDSGYFPIACVDDDPSKLGIRIHGVPVVGSIDRLPHFVSLHRAEEVLIAIPSATRQQMRRFVEVCELAGVSFKTVPALRDVISGQVGISSLRDVNLDDLLGREPVTIDLDSVREQIAGRTVAVTGAVGTIGSELSRQILQYGPARLVCLDQNETGVFYAQNSLGAHRNGTELVFRVVDVGDPVSARRVFGEFRPDVVFHAAAYKHVPVMEVNVHEAVRNNVLGLLNVLEAAEENGCKKFVLISSDKAVNPTSVMGATKRVGELIMASRPTERMLCVSVRFGNVLGSSGSVVPVFQEQLRTNGPLTITHPDIKRFFMTTQEAVALVLQAFAIGNHRDILVLDMGEPILILDLAKNLIRLSGKTEEEVQIRITGLRDGEKLKEELFYPTEQVLATSCEKVKRTCGHLAGWDKLSKALDDLQDALTIDGPQLVRSKIKEIVPEFSYLSSEAQAMKNQKEPSSPLSRSASAD